MTRTLHAVHIPEQGHTMLSAMALGLQKSPEGQICLFGKPVGIGPSLSLPQLRLAPHERGCTELGTQIRSANVRS